MHKQANKRYCFAKFCPNYYGTNDLNVKFFRYIESLYNLSIYVLHSPFIHVNIHFRSPSSDPELKAKWEQIVDRKTGGRFLLCTLHFKEEDILWHNKIIRLKKGAIPKPWFGDTRSTLNKDAFSTPIETPMTEKYL